VAYRDRVLIEVAHWLLFALRREVFGFKTSLNGYRLVLEALESIFTHNCPATSKPPSMMACAFQGCIKRHVHVHVHRGVQYVHWVMHKCIMVKVGGKIHTKYVKSW